MPRLFAALDLPDAARDAVEALRADLDGTRWTPPENYHLTLRFFGEVDEARVPEVKAALADVTAAPPVLQSIGLTALPSRRRPRVLAIAFPRTDALAALHEQVEEAARTLGFEPERRQFRPHVTFARLKRTDRRAVARYLRASEAPELSFTASSFYLYESVLRSEGARHHRRVSFELQD